MMNDPRQDSSPVGEPTLWSALYVALWLNACALAALVCRGGHPDGEWVVAWCVAAAVLGAAALMTGSFRAIIHDLLIDLTPRERILSGVMVFVVFLLPALVEEPRVIPDGFLWATPLLLLLAVRPVLARGFLAWTLVGAFCAAREIGGEDGLVLILIFGSTWVLALGASHFTFTGDPHGLSGWRPIRGIARNALTAGIPAALATVVAWLVWPGGGLPWSRSEVAPSGAVADQQRQLSERIERIDLLALIWQSAVALLILVIVFIGLLYLRKLWLRRLRQHNDQPDMLQGQVAQLEYRQRLARPPAPRLVGLRGRIVRLWSRWAGALEREGLGRREGETAADFARRLDHEKPEAAPPEDLTLWLERAHYGPDEPTQADVEAMRDWVHHELSRQSLRRQAPMESIDDPPEST